MPTPATVAVIDIGKTNAKVVLIDTARGVQIDALSMPNKVVEGAPYPHADVDGLWAFILASLKTLNARHQVSAISITTHGATGALVTAEGLALPVLDYEYRGPEETAGEYGKVRPAFAESYSPLLPVGLNLGAQIFWQARRFPQEFANVTAILAYPQYWAWRLTGVMASEVTSLGCHTDLWAPDQKTFSSLVAKEGWGRLFPPVRPAASVLGPILPAIAAATGVPDGTPVACGIHDSNASLLPHLGQHETPFTVISTGTWTICMTVGGSTAGLDPERDSLANVDAYGRPVPTARFMGGREFDLLAGSGHPPAEADIDRVIEEQIQVLPTFVPGVGTFPNSEGRWTHSPEKLNAGERTAAVSLYLALVAEAALSLCGIGRQIIVEGPLARNALFGQALAALTGVGVTASADATGTSLGASLLLAPVGGEAEESPAVRPLDHKGLTAYRQAWLERAKA
ncbi:FGGY-family carbohydrate kinase [Devosia nitrariae]|uniref:Carbohydrate kinase n=1 Tax=Devosia nitrariae TaxID=2071872 RepID=A0ABQ5W5E5_9HYPH|nr:FGGY-family carbohydrate kinase [Devosia nitrariae]GLQ55084.1 carbohydrate kinase [Devosia nitrariae]